VLLQADSEQTMPFGSWGGEKNDATGSMGVAAQELTGCGNQWGSGIDGNL
jgi:hypothetical protein